MKVTTIADLDYYKALRQVMNKIFYLHT